jgi:hypothetical protein
MYKKYISYICIFIILICIEIRVYYKYIVQTYLNLKIVNKLWKKYINPDNVSYGLWDMSHNTIEKANTNLYSFMYSKADINDTHTVLNIPNKKKEKKEKKEKKQKKWDRIIAIEEDLTNVHDLLNENGILVCSNIVLKDNTPSSFYIDIICDFLCTKITYSEWKSKLENDFNLVELHNTENSMNTYYTYLFNSYISKKHLPQWVADILVYYFKDIPFQYIIAVCKK